MFDGFSQSGQDYALFRSYFAKARGGNYTYVDIGANDGLLGSNTAFFDRCLGWRGVCVEPQLNEFLNVMSERTCRPVFGAVGDAPGYAEFTRVGMGYLSGLESGMGPSQRQWLETETLSRFETFVYKTSDIFQSHGILHIDYLSIDVEGNELAVLKGIDWGRVSIDVISAETKIDNDGEIFRYLSSKGFRFKTRVGMDSIFVRFNVKFD